MLRTLRTLQRAGRMVGASGGAGAVAGLALGRSSMMSFSSSRVMMLAASAGLGAGAGAGAGAGSETQLVLSREGHGGRMTLELGSTPVSFYLSPESSLDSVATSIAAESGSSADGAKVEFLTGPPGTLQADASGLARVARGTKLGNLLPHPSELVGASRMSAASLAQKLKTPQLYVSVDGELTRIVPVLDARTPVANVDGVVPKQGEFKDYDRILADVKDLAAEKTQIKVDDFVELCGAHGVGDAEARRVLACMHGAGDILHFADEPHMDDTVFLNPDVVDGEVRRSLRIRTLEERDSERDRRATIINLIVDELQPLVDVKATLDKKAFKHARRVMWTGWSYSAIQLAVITRLTWWEFSWDVMEPLSFFFGLTTIAFFSGMFVFRGAPVDAFSTLQQWLQDRKAAKLYRKAGLDLDRYSQLKVALEYFEEEEADDLASHQ